MNQGIISYRYAKALFSLGEEKGQLETLREDLEGLAPYVAIGSELSKVMDSPVIKQQVKKEVLQALFADKVSEATMNFLHMLVHNRREGMLRDIIRRFVAFYEEKFGIIRAHLTTSVGIDTADEAAIQTKLEAMFKSKIRMESSVDKSLLGGFIIRVGDTQYDASLRRGLERVRTRMVDENDI